MLLFLSFTPESLGSPPSCVPKEQKAPLLFLLFYALVPKEPLSSRRFYLLFRRNKRDERGSSAALRAQLEPIGNKRYVLFQCFTPVFNTKPPKGAFVLWSGLIAY